MAVRTAVPTLRSPFIVGDTDVGDAPVNRPRTAGPGNTMVSSRVASSTGPRATLMRPSPVMSAPETLFCWQTA